MAGRTPRHSPASPRKQHAKHPVPRGSSTRVPFIGPGSRPLPDLSRHVLENMKSGLLVVNMEGKVILMNSSAKSILGIDGRTKTGGDCRALLSDYPYLADLLLGSFRRSTLPDRAEVEVRAKSGEGRKVIGYTLSPVLGDAKEQIGAALFFKDLTAVEMEETKARIKDRLVTLGEMTAWLAHEIRNPLAAVGVNAGLLAKGEKDPQRRELTREILNEVKKMNNIITRTLDFAKPRPVNLQECDIEGLLKDCVQATAPGKAGIRIRWALAGIGKVLLDSTQISTALQNLIRNSFEAMPKGGTLTLRTRLSPSEVGRGVPDAFKDHLIRKEENIIIEIEDTGRGMEKDLLDKIFTPYFTTKESGTGLGMSIAQKYISEHWGVLDVETQPGRGTRFTVILPYYTAK